MFELRSGGNFYVIHDNGDIERTDLVGFKPSGKWKMLGLQSVYKREFIPLGELAEKLPTLTLTFKNGNPRYRVRDLDHGSVREWGNGVTAIAVIYQK